MPRFDIEDYFNKIWAQTRPILDHDGVPRPPRTPAQLAADDNDDDWHGAWMLPDSTGEDQPQVHGQPASNRVPRPVRTSSMFNPVKQSMVNQDRQLRLSGDVSVPQDSCSRDVNKSENHDHRGEHELQRSGEVLSQKARRTMDDRVVGEETTSSQYSALSPRHGPQRLPSSTTELVSHEKWREVGQPQGASKRVSPPTDDPRLWLKYNKHLVEDMRSPRNSQLSLDIRHGRSVTTPSASAYRSTMDGLRDPSVARAGSHRSSNSEGGPLRDRGGEIPRHAGSYVAMGATTLQSPRRDLQQDRALKDMEDGQTVMRAASKTSQKKVRLTQHAERSEALDETQREHRQQPIPPADWVETVVPPALKVQTSQRSLRSSALQKVEAFEAKLRRDRRRESLARRYPKADPDQLMDMDERVAELLKEKKPQRSSSLGSLRSAAAATVKSRIRGLVKPAPGRAVVLSTPPAADVPPVPEIPARFQRHHETLQTVSSEANMQGTIGAPGALDPPRMPWLKHETSATMLAGTPSKASSSALPVTLPGQTSTEDMELLPELQRSDSLPSLASSDRSIHPALRPGFNIDYPVRNGSSLGSAGSEIMDQDSPGGHSVDSQYPPSPFPPPQAPLPPIPTDQRPQPSPRAPAPRASFSLFPRMEDPARRDRAATEAGRRPSMVTGPGRRPSLPVMHDASDGLVRPAGARRGIMAAPSRNLQSASAEPLRSTEASRSVWEESPVLPPMMHPQAPRPRMAPRRTEMIGEPAGGNQTIQHQGESAEHSRRSETNIFTSLRRSSASNAVSASPSMLPDEQRISSSWMPSLQTRHRRNLTRFDEFLQRP